MAMSNKLQQLSDILMVAEKKNQMIQEGREKEECFKLTVELN
jgi:hypothetical protein